MTAHRQFETTAERNALDSRDDRFFHLIECCVDGPKGWASQNIRPTEFTDVCSRAESTVRADKHHRVDGGIAGSTLKRLEQWRA